MANLSAAVARAVGPLLPEQRTGRANLKAAFPEKSDAEIEAILGFGSRQILDRVESDDAGTAAANVGLHNDWESQSVRGRSGL